jgi:hypothetical protein
VNRSGARLHFVVELSRSPPTGAKIFLLDEKCGGVAVRDKVEGEKHPGVGWHRTSGADI